MAEPRQPPEPPEASGKPQDHEVWCTEYVHYRTGKRMVAADYGYSTWHFRAKNRRTTK
jgi:hypothetical protein